MLVNVCNFEIQILRQFEPVAPLQKARWLSMDRNYTWFAPSLYYWLGELCKLARVFWNPGTTACKIQLCTFGIWDYPIIVSIVWRLKTIKCSVGLHPTNLPGSSAFLSKVQVCVKLDIGRVTGRMSSSKTLPIMKLARQNRIILFRKWGFVGFARLLLRSPFPSTQTFSRR